MNNKLKVLNFITLSIVIGAAMLIQSYFIANPILNPLFDSAVIYLTSVGFYELLLKIIHGLVEKIPFLLRFYWGRMFVHGLWSYSYTVDGGDNTVFIGVWRFEQDLFLTQVVGFGLDTNFNVRSRVRSLSDMLKTDNMYEFINARSDAQTLAQETISKTNMFFELSRKFLFPIPTRMRGTTVIFGGERNGGVCNNYFLKHPNARTEEEVISIMRQNLEKYGAVHPPRETKNGNYS